MEDGKWAIFTLGLTFYLGYDRLSNFKEEFGKCLLAVEGFILKVGYDPELR